MHDTTGIDAQLHHLEHAKALFLENPHHALGRPLLHKLQELKARGMLSKAQQLEIERMLGIVEQKLSGLHEDEPRHPKGL